jgi:carbon-monoxide dehydrogenase medium subunit
VYPFQYIAPKLLQEASSLLLNNTDAKALAGGMSLIPTMKLRLARPSHLVDLSAITELRGIQLESEKLIVGAMERHVIVARSQLVRRNIPALAELAEGIGDPHVRNRGTIGGSLANNDPAADYPAAALGLDALVHTSKRAIPAEEYFCGLFTTALEREEIITRIEFRIPEHAAYVKFLQPASRFAMVGVWVSKFISGVRVAVTGAGPSVFRCAALETILTKTFAPTALEGVTVPADGLNSDIHGSASYRAHLIAVMARRAVQKCLS